MNGKFKLGDKVKVFGGGGVLNGIEVYLHGYTGAVVSIIGTEEEGPRELGVIIEQPIRGHSNFRVNVHPYQCRHIIETKEEKNK